MHVAPHENGKIPGASHCDELPYIFKTGKRVKIESPTLASKEFTTIMKMTETFAAFAETGNPNNREIPFEWTAINSMEEPFECMNIDQDEVKMMQLPEAERLKLWNEIYGKEKIDLY